jgi:hypothetical protein
VLSARKTSVILTRDISDGIGGVTMARDMSERAGLEYLYQAGKVRRSEEEHDQPGAPVIGVQAYVPKRVLQAINSREESTGKKGVRLKEIAKDADMGPELLIPMASRLRDAQLVVVLEEEWGNDLVSLSPMGKQLLEKSDDEELVRLVGGLG